MRSDVMFVGMLGIASGDRHQSAPSDVALTDAALTVPEENSMPAFTHLQERGCGVIVLKLRLLVSDDDRRDSVGSDWLGASPAKITSPP